jgi:hypothetical protein
MKKRELLFPIAVSLLLLCTSWAQDVRYNFDKNADFSKYKTYRWVTLKDVSKMNELVDNDIKTSIDRALASKGLVRSDAESADLYIGYQGAVGEEKQFTSYNTDWGYGSGWNRGGWYGPSSSMTTGQTSTIHIGQLALDMYDSNNHSLIWRGIASKTLDPKAKPEKQQKNLNKAVDKLLKNYPPKAK